MDDAKVRITGLREVASALRQIDAELPKAMKQGFTDLADRVADRVRPKVPRRTGKAAESVKGRGTSRGGSIVAGGRAAAHYPWLDFGGRVGPNKSIERPFIREGRYIYPTLRESSTDIREETDELLTGLITKAGFETRG